MVASGVIVASPVKTHVAYPLLCNTNDKIKEMDEDSKINYPYLFGSIG